MKVGYCQFLPRFGEKESNLKNVEELLGGCNADLMVLPELFSTGYQFMDRNEAYALAETADGQTIQWAKSVAENIGGCLCGGFAERFDGQVFNSAFLVGPDSSVNIYRKIHLFDREKECFDPGDGGFDVIQFGDVKLGMMICFDWIFPESMRTLALKGAQIICHPSNLVLPFCQQAMTVRCLENGVFAITANRIGQEDRIGDQPLTFTGQSQITAPKGKIMDRASENFKGIKVLEIDPQIALDKKINPRNDLFLDRRDEKYKQCEGNEK